MVGFGACQHVNTDKPIGHRSRSVPTPICYSLCWRWHRSLCQGNTKFAWRQHSSAPASSLACPRARELYIDRAMYRGKRYTSTWQIKQAAGTSDVAWVRQWAVRVAGTSCVHLGEGSAGESAFVNLRTVDRPESAGASGKELESTSPPFTLAPAPATGPLATAAAAALATLVSTSAATLGAATLALSRALALLLLCTHTCSAQTSCCALRGIYGCEAWTIASLVARTSFRACCGRGRDAGAAAAAEGFRTLLRNLLLYHIDDLPPK
jgi:hypothetical protein